MARHTRSTTTQPPPSSESQANAPAEARAIKAKAKAKSPAKAASKKKVNPTVKSKNVTKTFKNGSKEITLEFPVVGKSINQLIFLSQLLMLRIGELNLPSTPTPNHHKLPSFDQNSDQAIAGPSTPHQSNRHVAFDLTPAAPPVDLTPNQCDSPWLNSPSDARPSSSDVFLTNNLPPDTPENFNYVFQSPLTPSRPPGSVRSRQQPFTTPETPSSPHHNHGHEDCPYGPNQTASRSPSSGPAGNRRGKEASDVQPFFSEETDRRVCKLCQ